MPDDPTSKSLLKEIGTTGLRQYGGRIDEEFLNSLRGRRAVQVYREMRDNDPLIGAIVLITNRLINQVDWEVNPADDSDAARKEADFVQECLEDMSMTFSETITEMLSMVTYGWSYHEIVYRKRLEKQGSKFNDGRYGWKKMPVRSQDTLDQWEFDEESGSIKGMWQNPINTVLGHRVYIPIERALLFRTFATKGNPEGRSAFRNAYRPWFFKKRIEEIEAIGIDRDLAGLPVMYLPPDFMAEDAPPWKQAIFRESQNIVANIRRDEQEGLVMPFVTDESGNQMMKLELLSAGGTRQFDTSAIIERWDRRIAMTVLADFILLGHENVGSFALSSDKTNLFSITLDAILKDIRDVFNNFAIPRLMKINGVKPALMPKLAYGDVEDYSIQDVMGFVSELINAGVPIFPDEKLTKHLFDRMKLPYPEHKLDGSEAPGAIDGPSPAVLAQRTAEENLKQLEFTTEQQQNPPEPEPAPEAAEGEEEPPLDEEDEEGIEALLARMDGGEE